MNDRFNLPPLARRLLWPVLTLGVLLLFNLFFTPGFFRVVVQNGYLYGSLIDVLKQAAPVALMSIGMSLVIATGGVDLSVGAIAAIAGTVAVRVLTSGHPSFGLAVTAALVLSLVLGAGNGLLVSGFGVQPIVATLILMVAGRGVAQLLSEGQILTVENDSFSFLALGHFLALPTPVSIVVIMYVLTAVLMRTTALGLYVEAVGDNVVASRYAGLQVRGVQGFVYAFSGLCAGVAGLIISSDIKAADANNAGLYTELDAILAVVIGGGNLAGGRFSLAGSFVGALTIQTLVTTILTKGVPVQYTLVVKAVVVIVVCLLQAPAFRQLFAPRRAPAAS